MSERDTQFSGFAKLLWSDILAKIEQIEVDNDDLVDGCSMCSTPPEQVAALIEPLIAERAYDFLVASWYHTLLLPTWPESRRRVAILSDITEWPKPE